MRYYLHKIVFVLPVLLLVLSACDLTGGAVDTATTKATAVLNNAIGALATTSTDWQSVLQDAQAKLTDSAQSTIRAEVSTTLNRAVQASGSEIRCVIDMLRLRVREDLLRIRAALLHEPANPPEPVLCSLAPPVVDMTLDPTRRSYITLDGYNFDTTPPIQVFLVDGTQRTDVSGSLDRQTYYHMTLNLGDNGIRITSSSQKVVLQWNGQQISSIPVIRATPQCVTKTDKFTPAAITFIPPFVTKNGDQDFHGNGPIVTVKVLPTASASQVNMIVTMDAKETVSDFTEASGTKTFTVYTPPPGWSILIQSVKPLSSQFTYTHSNDNKVDELHPGEGPVEHFELSGFEGGQAAGVTTEVNVFFNEVTLQLTQTQGCQITP
jgi:hypothetical protein